MVNAKAWCRRGMAGGKRGSQKQHSDGRTADYPGKTGTDECREGGRVQQCSRVTSCAREKTHCVKTRAGVKGEIVDVDPISVRLPPSMTATFGPPGREHTM